MLQTLLIDNYDSFTFNLYQLLAQVNGAPPRVVRNDQVVDWDALDFDNIVLSPGPGRPERGEDFGICRDALRRAEVPILGICLGHQGIGHHFGGRVIPAPEPVHGRIDRVHHAGDALFAGMPSPFEAVRYHSLVLEPRLPEALEALAWTEDGLIMGIRHRSLPIWGVQFHPESICTEHGARLLANFARSTVPRQRVPRARGRLHGAVPGVPGVARAARPGQSEPELVVSSRKLALTLDPERVFVHLFGRSETAYWLDSSRTTDAGLARFSFMGDGSGPDSFLVSYDVTTREVEIQRRGERVRHGQGFFEYLEAELARRRARPADLPFDFQGGLVGYLGYELKAECGGAAGHVSSLPDACLLFSDRFVAFDHQTGAVYLVAVTEPGRAAAAQRWFDAIEARLRDLAPCPPLPRPARQVPLRLRLGRSRARYLEDIRDCQEQIRRGESYELCLTQQIHAGVAVDPLVLHRVLRAVNPAPYASFLRFPGFAVVSCSPERFLRIEQGGWVESRPIKGTIRRDPDPALDRALAEQLRASAKDRAESLMIVDLVRNDLGRTCEVGSVTVPRLMDIESYATVHQMVSTIRGRLRPDSSAVECIRAAFPGGSMTGAPKLRTMAILDRLENEARGVYSGSIGYLSTTGTADLGIVIRTAVVTRDAVAIGVGGAIVALSDPAAEFAEILLKARALVQGLAIAVNGDETPDMSWLEHA